MSGLVETRPARRRSIKTALVDLARRWGAEQIVPVGNELFRTPIRSASSSPEPITNARLGRG